MKFDHESPINNESVLVQLMAWYRTGAKPLAQRIMILFKDAYMHYPASMSQEFRSHVQKWCQYVVW